MSIKFVLKIIVLSFFISTAMAADNWPTVFEKKHPIQTELSTQFYKELPVAANAPGEVILVNFELMKKLGLMSITEDNNISEELSAKILQGFNLRVAKEGDAPIGKAIATYYADGGKDYSSGRGDGRALWIAEINVDGKTYDVSAKGTGDTGLGYKELAGHSDGLAHVSDALQEYYAGEVLYRSGISDASRILAVIKLPIKKTLTGGEQVDAAVMVRVSPTNLRFAHQWRYGNEPEAMAKLLEYYFKRQSSYKNLDFKQQVRKLLIDNIETSARELAYFDQSLYSQASPTKGNRLLNGQLIDFGTFQAFDVPFLDFYSDKDLGKVSDQKDFSLFWNQKLKKNLSKLASLEDVDVDLEFKKTYTRYSQKMVLQRLGLATELANDLMLKHPDVTAELLNASEILRTAMTNHKMPVGKMNIHAPVVDVRKVYRDLSWKDLIAPGETNMRILMNSFSTPYSKQGYNTVAVQKGFQQFKDSARKIFNIIIAEQNMSAVDFMTTIETKRVARNSKHRGPGLGSRLRRMNAWRDIEGKNRAALLSTLENSIEEAIDFKVSKDSPGSEAPESVLLDLLARDSENKKAPESKKAVSGLLKEWMASRGKPLSANAVLNSKNTHLIAEEVRAAGGLSAKWMLVEAITDKFEKNPAANSPLLENLLIYSPQDFRSSNQEVLESEKAWDNILVSGKEVNRQQVGGNFTLITYQQGDYFYSKAFDSTGNLVFQDGPRYVYTSKSLNTVVLSTSLVHTYTNPQYQNMGLYQKAFQQYLDKNPKVSGVWLNSENPETMELYAKAMTFLKSQTSRERLVKIPAFVKFFEQVGIAREKIEQPTPEVITEMINNILTLSLQGRVRLKSGFSFEFQPNNFGTFYSRKITPEKVQSMNKAILELETYLTNSKEFDSLVGSLLPKSYLDFTREKAARKVPSVPMSCQHLFAKAL
jgi:uncharacterized protein YdiU (UPF0061 family)